MEELKKHIYDEHNGLHYTLVGDYYIPDLPLPEKNPLYWDLEADAQSLSGAVSSDPL